MTVRNAIPLDQVCRYFNIEIEIVRDFAKFGLVPTIHDDEETGVELQHLESEAPEEPSRLGLLFDMQYR